jgi:hypothetical protein
MFLGFFRLDVDDLFGLYQSRNTSRTPTADDGTPAYRIYGEAGLMTSGTGNAVLFDSSNTTGLYKVTHTISSANGYERGKCYTLRVTGTVGAVARCEEFTFIVT